MLSIRFLRIGKKHQPSYKIVVVDKKRSPKSGKFIEQLGFYNPITKEKGINGERVIYWLSQGAQSSEVVHNLLIREGVIKGEKIAVHSKKLSKKKNLKGAKKQVETETQTEKQSEEVLAKEVKESEKKEEDLPKGEKEEKEGENENNDLVKEESIKKEELVKTVDAKVDEKIDKKK